MIDYLPLTPEEKYFRRFTAISSNIAAVKELPASATDGAILLTIAPPQVKKTTVNTTIVMWGILGGVAVVVLILGVRHHKKLQARKAQDAKEFRKELKEEFGKPKNQNQSVLKPGSAEGSNDSKKELNSGAPDSPSVPPTGT
jgi:hypothetical protein